RSRPHLKLHGSVHRLHIDRPFSVDHDYLSSCCVESTPSDFACDYAGLRVARSSIQIIGADDGGLLHESPAATMGIVKFALHDAGLRLIADIACDRDSHANHSLCQGLPTFHGCPPPPSTWVSYLSRGGSVHSWTVRSEQPVA